eukprot:365790-Chlamydomonas_euryale.AAC.2
MDGACACVWIRQPGFDTFMGVWWRSCKQNPDSHTFPTLAERAAVTHRPRSPSRCRPPLPIYPCYRTWLNAPTAPMPTASPHLSLLPHLA